MPKFQYVAMDQSGQEVKDEIEAGSTEDALAKIRGMGYFPTKIKEKGAKKKGAAGPKRKKSGGITIGGVALKQLTQFTRQLSTLQDAGLPILRSLQILEQQQKPGLLKNVLGEVSGDVEGGATLSEAMAKHPKAFDRLYTNMVAAGEAGGVLDVILRRLADFMESSEKLKRKVKGAMVYPVAVILFAMGIVTGIMITVVPKFKDIFKDFETGMPGVTLMLLKMSDFVVGKKDLASGERVDTLPGWIIILVSPVAIFLLFKLIRQSKTGSYAMDAVSLRIPILGQILGKTAVARFTRTLGTLIAAGVPILEALSITRETSGNAVFAKALGLVHDSIREGESFAQPLRASKVVDGLVVNMIDVGEETGELDKMLYKVADNYDDEVDALVGSLVSLLEPVIVVVLGGIVGFIVIALFLPLVKLIGAVTGGGV